MPHHTIQHHTTLHHTTHTRNNRPPHSAIKLSLQGVLTLPNGDYFDGTFDGKWGDGISMTGKFYKCFNQHPRGLQIEEIELSQQK